MDIKSKLKQIRNGSMSYHSCTDSICSCSLEHLTKAGVFLCNMPVISDVSYVFLSRYICIINIPFIK